jgi:hypothetical protein
MTDPPPLPAFGTPSLMADLRWWADHLPPDRLMWEVTGLKAALELAAETLTQAEAQIAALIAERDQLLTQPYGKMRRALTLRAEAAEARADAADAALRTRQPQQE